MLKAVWHRPESRRWSTVSDTFFALAWKSPDPRALRAPGPALRNSKLRALGPEPWVFRISDLEARLPPLECPSVAPKPFGQELEWAKFAGGSKGEAIVAAVRFLGFQSFRSRGFLVGSV